MPLSRGGGVNRVGCLYLATDRHRHGHFALSPVWLALTFARITAVFNNMRTLKFKPQPTVTFFAAVNQISGGFRLLPSV